MTDCSVPEPGKSLKADSTQTFYTENADTVGVSKRKAQNRKKSKRSDQLETFPDGQDSDSTGQAREKAAEVKK
jgi:hypothetical protein